MFKRGSSARIVKEKNNLHSVKEKSEKRNGSASTNDNPSAISMRSSNDHETIIGAGMTIEGNISGSGNVIIEGAMKGDIELEGDSITVGPEGQVEGNIIAKDAVISGQMKGKINATGTVNIAQHADFCGEIKAKNISIDDGAFFKGEIEMDRESRRDRETTHKLIFKPSEKQNKVYPMPAAEPVT